MRVRTGTSGFSYKEWKGAFYPEKLAAKDMLRFYAERLPAVEINNTFYRMPKSALLEGWAEQVPDGFQFVIKASQRITHHARLAGTEELVDYLWQAVQHLGTHRGPLLFQLPPYLKKDVPLLRAFVEGLPEACRAVFEFRHATWIDDEVHDVLRERGCALCIADSDKDAAAEFPEIVVTADWGYLRLRRDSYDEAQLDALAERMRSQPWEEAFVFFKHEDGGAAPNLAVRFGEKF